MGNLRLDGLNTLDEAAARASKFAGDPPAYRSRVHRPREEERVAPRKYGFWHNWQTHIPTFRWEIPAPASISLGEVPWKMLPRQDTQADPGVVFSFRLGLLRFDLPPEFLPRVLQFRALL
jgi:hypothetical protein